MSSNIKLLRNCDYCKNNFIAKTTTTRFCSKVCNSRFYKARKRTSKIFESDIESTLRSNIAATQQIKKEILTVKEVGELLNSSVSAIYAMIKSGRLKATNFAARKTMILRSDVMSIFESEYHSSGKIFIKNNTREETDITIDESNGYTISDLIPIFGQTREVLYTTLSRQNIPKIKIGKCILFYKVAIDKLIKERNIPRKNPLDAERKANDRIQSRGLKISECYDIDECVKRFGKSRGVLYGIFKRHKTPKLKIGKQVYMSKIAIDKLLKASNKANKK